MASTDAVKTSVIITAYNYQEYVRECIASCLAQEGPHGGYEVLLVDDGSTDRTAEVAQSYEPRIRVIVKPNGGVEQAANLGLQEAAGEFVVRVDADDRLNPAYLRTMVPALDATDAAFAYPEYETIGPDSQRIQAVELPDFDTSEIRSRGDFLATGTLYRKSVVMQVGPYNESVTNCGLENYELILRMLANGLTGRCVHAVLFGYRLHGTNMSSTRRESIIEYGERLAAEFGLPRYTTNQYHPSSLAV